MERDKALEAFPIVRNIENEESQIELLELFIKNEKLVGRLDLTIYANDKNNQYSSGRNANTDSDKEEEVIRFINNLILLHKKRKKKLEQELKDII